MYLYYLLEKIKDDDNDDCLFDYNSYFFREFFWKIVGN